MRKLTLILAVLLSSLAASANNWAIVTSEDFNKEHVIYAGFNGMTPDDIYYVGVFIDGDCRVEADIKRGASGGPAEPLHFEIRVPGSDADAGKAMTFKIYDAYGESYYTLTQTLAYEPEGTTGMPSELYNLALVKATGYTYPVDELQMYPDDTYEITYTVTPEGAQLPDGFDDMFRVDSDVDGIASISGKTVTALSEGTAYIFNACSGVDATNDGINLTVVARPIGVESITLNDYPSTLKVGISYALHDFYTVNPENASNKAVTFSVSNDIVSIEEWPSAANQYQLTANAKGTTQVTVTSVDNPDATATMTFTVKQPVESISPNTAADFNINVGEDYYLGNYYIINPEDADDLDVAVENFSESLIQVQGYGQKWNIHPLAAGEARLQVSSVANPNACTILIFQISQLATSVTIEPEALDMTIGQELDIAKNVFIEFLPAGSSQEYTISSSNEDVAIAHNSVERAPYIEALAEGTAIMTVTATDGSGVSGTFTVNVYPALEGFELDFEEINMVTQTKATVNIYPLPTNALMTGELHFAISNPYSSLSSDTGIDNQGAAVGNPWKFVEGNLSRNDDGIYQLELSAFSIGEGSISFSYDGSEAGLFFPSDANIHVGYEYPLAKGWNWITTISNGDSYVKQSLEEMMADNLIEARTQDGLLYNDPVYGYYGDFNDFTAENKFYKVKSADEATITTYGNYNDLEQYGLVSGWNWIPYPCEYDSQIAFAGADGDVILSLTDGMAVYTEQAWSPANFQLKAGQGYLYYTTSARQLSLPSPYSCTQPTEITDERPLYAPEIAYWSYNPRLYNSLMPMIATIEGYDTDNYTVGAFVGKECRGEGRLVDGKWYITVAGEGGDEISFRIFNKFTGEFTEVSNTVKMSSMLGSIKNPVQLFADPEGVTSIITIDGNSIDLNDSSNEWYNLQGQRVSRPHNGVFILNGRKVLVK